MKMSRRIRLGVKFVLFFLVTALCVAGVERLITPKYYYNQQWPTTNTFRNFYKVKKNSVDVLMFGSSHAVATFNPQVMYDSCGITSYSLSCEQQSLVVSYYWLREALRYQSPRAVVLDTYMLHKYADASYVYNDLNCSEGSIRKAMDCMRWSPLKWQAAREIARIDPTQSALSFTFPNIRYHARWSDLEESDYTEESMIDHGSIRGYSVLADPAGEYTPFSKSDALAVEAEPMMETMREYLDKIVDLCRERNIQLVLVNIPCAEPMGRYKSTWEYARAHDLPYYDFNEKKVYEESGYNSVTDGLNHPNYHGAEKVTRYLGRLLAEKYDVPGRRDDSFDRSRELYQHQIDNITLTRTTDMEEYLKLLKKDDYTLFLFAPRGYGGVVTDETAQELRDLGFTAELRGAPEEKHYCAVRDQGRVTEKFTDSDLSLSGSVRDGREQYAFVVDTSTVTAGGHIYSLTVGKWECGNGSPGIQIAVYDNDLKKIIDQVCFSESDGEVSATRF